MADKSGASRQQRRERTVRELLDAAAVVFAEGGYHATSVDQVAAAAGYTKGAVYSNFDSKEELFLALIDRHIDQAVDLLEAIVGDIDPQKRAAAVADRRGEMAVFDPQWFLLETEFLLYAARNEAVRDRVAQRQRRTRDRIAALLGRHLDDLAASDSSAAGGNGGVDADDLAKLLIATGDGLTLMGLIDPGDIAVGSLMGTAIDLMTRGLLAAPSGGPVTPD